MKRPEFVDFNEIIKEADRQSCAMEIDYQVVRTDEAIWSDVKSTLTDKVKNEPVIVFVDQKKKIKKFKRSASHLRPLSSRLKMIVSFNPFYLS